MPHVVLLGDSIFDNGVYTSGGPDVVTQLRKTLPASWEASLVAVDGHVTSDIPRQLAKLPAGATHIALSVGGNDALQCLPVLDAPTSNLRQGLATLAALIIQFESQYAGAVAACQQRSLPMAVCTIYNGCFADAAFQRVATTFVALFNDVILRTAARHALPVVDLRAVCCEPADYANPIEPSSTGGEKIARALAAVLTGDGLRSPATRVTLA
ncbi:MAG TPA: SGNH/GDSL hydrolase family protein [Vicinamibacterales bacterium]|nr:SGNH/GDSL hydrolase family protein [Vicinamibacterales bacterium]